MTSKATPTWCRATGLSGSPEPPTRRNEQVRFRKEAGLFRT